jgi:integrase
MGRGVELPERADFEALPAAQRGRRARRWGGMRQLVRPGERPQLSKGYHYNVAMWLREFARTFPGTAVCNLNKDLLNALAAHTDVGPRTRNARRIVVTMFLKWCVRADLLPAGHRLLEADGMARENDTPDCLDFYRPAELAALLQAASERPEYQRLLPIIALQGLAGLRLQEAVRLEWPDVWRVSYDLRRLRLHGFIERLRGTHRYQLTEAGLKTALFYSRAYQRLLRPELSSLHAPPLPECSDLAKAYHAFQRQLTDYFQL